jgi:hypothetical protein
MRDPRRRAAQAWAPLVGLAVCLAVAGCSSSTRTVGPLQPKSCTVQGLSARRGTLSVPEDRLSGNGRMISVKFVVIPARGHNRAPDPVVDFSGGPGGADLVRAFIDHASASRLNTSCLATISLPPFPLQW